MALYRALTEGQEIEGEDARRWRRYKIMKEMGWTYQEYRRTPASLVAEIWMMMQTEAQAESDTMKERMEHGR